MDEYLGGDDCSGRSNLRGLILGRGEKQMKMTGACEQALRKLVTHVHVTTSYKGVRGNDPLGDRVESMARKQLSKRTIAIALPAACMDVPYSPVNEFYGTLNINGVDIYAINSRIREFDPQGEGALSDLEDFSSTFWALVTTGSMGNVTGVHGHGNLGAFAVSIGPAEGDEVVRLFTPYADFGRLYRPASEAQAQLLGGWDPETGPAHFGEMNLFKLGALSAGAVIMTTAQYTAIHNSDLTGFLAHQMKISSSKFIIDDRLFLEEYLPRMRFPLIVNID